MGTNTPAKIPDIIRLAVTGGAETPLTFPGAVSIIDFTLQALEASGTYVSFHEGGTFSPDNYFTLKSGNILYQQDINWTPPENAMWLRSAGGVATIEVIYWS